MEPIEKKKCSYPKCEELSEAKIICPKHEDLADFILFIVQNNITINDLV